MNDILLLIGRSLLNTLREPAAIIPNIAISVFFLFVYNTGLSSVADLPGFKGTYLGFILPVAIVSAAIGGAGHAGQTLIRDIDSGYFTKLLLTPTRRLAVIWGPMMAGAIVLVVQVVLVMLIALALGLKVAAGPAASCSWWARLPLGHGVRRVCRLHGAEDQERCGDPGGDLRLLPADLPSYTFVPKEYITAGWLKVARRSIPRPTCSTPCARC